MGNVKMGVEADTADCDKVSVSSGSAQFAFEILTKELHFTLCLLASNNFCCLLKNK